MPDHAMLQKPYLKVVIGVALIAIAAVCLVVRQDGSHDNKLNVDEPSAPLTEPEKMDVLLQLSASATTSARDPEKQEILSGLRGSNPDAGSQTKTDVMRSLREN